MGYFWRLGAKVKIELPSGRELNFQGSRTSKIDIFSILLLRPSWERPRILLFPIFGRFWAHFGTHLGVLGGSFSNLYFHHFLERAFKAFFVKIGSKMAGGPLYNMYPPSPSRALPHHL